MHDPVFKRFLDYRDLHEYFGGRKPPMSRVDFEAFDAELLALMEKPMRSREEDDRLAELAVLLHRA